MRDGADVLEVERYGIQSLGVGAFAIEFVAVTILAVADIDLSAGRDQFTEALGIVFFQMAVGILQAHQVIAFAKDLHRGWRRRVDRAQLQRGLIARLHLQINAKSSEGRRHSENHIAQPSPGRIFHQCPDRPDQLSGTLLGRGEYHQHTDDDKEHIHPHQASGDRLAQPQIEYQPESAVNAADHEHHLCQTRQPQSLTRHAHCSDTRYCTSSCSSPAYISPE